MMDESTFIKLTISEARHQFNGFPKHFEQDETPIFVEQHGIPVMVILSTALFASLSGASQFIAEKGLDDEYDQWLEELVESDPEMDKEIETAQAIAENEARKEQVKALLETDETFRSQFIENLKETLQWAEAIASEKPA